MKPTKSFRLDRQVKRFMCSLVDPKQRSEYKNSMIQAQLDSEKRVVREKSNNRAAAPDEA